MPFFIINSVLLAITGVMIYEASSNAKRKFDKKQKNKIS